MNPAIELEVAYLAQTGRGFMLRFREGFEMDEIGGSLDAPILMPRGSLRSAGAATLDGKVYVAATTLRDGWLS